ncbi:hypothetical protein Y88_0257 [Novosphingobium nitrogenifigens DSM 19370]|uniref:Major facilitator superfamily (MFS) profile domain-containing protein n=1 Tax=Novosphingobium nitrogenifigens DSM 19370 TaxID=983920 RepID=F1ZB97_9SPHN|nr:MFS transporter [Novosphingobium nitrogenifigens]EGD58205.1 hypothetical protein Y88_0257 [Novosphingobium nitrogenifigens DSM 19370]
MGEDDLTPGRRAVAGFVIWLAIAVTVLDSTIANVALPVMARDFAVSPAAALWVVQGYQLAILAGVLTLSAVGERFGYHRVYLVGLGIFTLASLGCAAAPGLDVLVLARLAQGLGAAAIMSVNGALVRHTFPARMLGQAIGINALVVAISAMAGPPLAGLVLQLADWRWLFAVNLVVGVPALAAGAVALPRVRGALAEIDAGASVLSVIASLGLLGGLAQGHGVIALGAVALGLIALVLLVIRSRGRAYPLLPVDLVALAHLRSAYLASIANFGAQVVIGVSLPFILHDDFGFSPGMTGLMMAAIPLGLGAAAVWGGRFADRTPGQSGNGGLGMAALGLGGIALAPHGTVGAVVLVVGSLIAGAGFGLFQPANNRVMLGRAPRDRSGAAAGMMALSRLTGQSLGAALAGLLFRLGVTGQAGFAGVAALCALLGMMASRGRSAAGASVDAGQ